MKNIRYFRFPASLILGAFIIVMFTSYGNKKTHPSINEMIVNAFLSKNNDKKKVLSEFKNYSFLGFDLPRQCKGTAMVKDGFFQALDIVWITRDITDKIQNTEGNLFDLAALKATCDEGNAEMGVTEWIKHGGYSADVPEVPASLRHFYDPTKPEGNQYLTDITNAVIMGTIQRVLRNPHMNGIDWALGSPGDKRFDPMGHIYNWENGKAWMKMALESKDADRRSEFLGKAWRALGETLHMIADNGCPPHVRNDAHPSPLWGNNGMFGNPDPYEELMDIIRSKNPDEFMGFSRGTPDNTIKEAIAGMKRAEEVAKALAVFTNKNFVTNETISGVDKYGNPKKQIINCTAPYSSPLLENMTYNEADYTYNASGVKQCNDHNYFMKFIPTLCEPKVDMECVKSQAAVLIPCIIEAGNKVMELYIPKLEVNIKSAEKGIVTGEIKHLKDAEYTIEIKYNGKVNIVLKDKKFKIKDEENVMAKDGVFETSDLDFEKGDHIYAKLEFSGIRIESPEFVCSDIKVGYSRFKINVALSGTEVIESNTGSNSTESRNIGIIIDNEAKYALDWGRLPKLSWQGSKFLFEYKYQVKMYPTDVIWDSYKISGIISTGSPQTISGEAIYLTTTKFDDGTTGSNEIGVRFQNVPFKSGNEYGISFNFSSKNADIKKYISKYWKKYETRGTGAFYKQNLATVNWSGGGDISIGFYNK